MTTPRVGYVYWLSDGERVKIGFSSSPNDRIRSLQAISGSRLVLVALEPATIEREGELHRLFAPKRLSGEWFQFDNEMRSAATAIGIVGADTSQQGRYVGPGPLAEQIDARVETLSSILQAESRHALASDLATEMGWRKERISRELNGVEKFSIALLLAEIHFHLAEGRSEVVDNLIAVITEDRPPKICTDRPIKISTDGRRVTVEVQ